jgi:hypothetical protein
MNILQTVKIVNKTKQASYQGVPPGGGIPLTGKEKSREVSKSPPGRINF